MNVKLSISVPFELVKFCEEQIQSGRYKNISQCVAEAIKKLKEDEEN